jgi:hypothetical protein
MHGIAYSVDVDIVSLVNKYTTFELGTKLGSIRMRYCCEELLVL